MKDAAQMKRALRNYIERFNARDVPGIADLFAPDATIEDPVGGGNMVSGRAMIMEFYEKAMQTGAVLRLATSIRGSYGNSAAMAFEVMMPEARTIGVIDVMTFDEAGFITTMRAYWGPDDIS